MNNIGPESSKYLSDLLLENDKMTILHLSINIIYIGFNNLGEEGMELLSNALKENTTLTSLAISTYKVYYRRK